MSNAMVSPLVRLEASAASAPYAMPDAERQTILQHKAAQSIALLQRCCAAYGGREEVVFASSFGAEDMVLTQMIHAHQLPIAVFSLDTGRLPAETYQLMARVHEHYGLPLKIYCPPTDALEAYVNTHGVNAFYASVALRQECCRIRKRLPLQRALQGKKAWVTGLRAAQSITRQHVAARVFDEEHGLEKISPLVEWSEQDVWEWIHLHDIPYNDLHRRFYPSIGCAPCTRSITQGEDIRAGRWWWEQADSRECGLHPHDVSPPVRCRIE